MKKMIAVLLSVLPWCAMAASAEGAAVKSGAEVARDATAWLDQLKGTTYVARIRSVDGATPLPCVSVSERQFSFQEGAVQIGVGFKSPPKKESSREELQELLSYVALDRLPVPGVAAQSWETRLMTPVSSFKNGVAVEAFTNGILTLRVKTDFFAVSGRRTDILVPADAPLPEGTFFQIRRPFLADLVIEGRLFQ